MTAAKGKKQKSSPDPKPPATEISVISAVSDKIKLDLLAIPVFKSELSMDLVPPLDKTLSGHLRELAQSEKFTGEMGSQASFWSFPFKKNLRQITLFGLGTVDKWRLEDVRRACGSIARSCLQNKGTRLGFYLPGTEASRSRHSASYEDIAQAMVEGALLGSYHFSKYKHSDAKKTAPRDLEAISIVADAGLKKSVSLGIERGKVYALATREARHLVNEPPSLMTPQDLAQRARVLLKSHGIKMTVFSPQEIKRKGMNAYLAVSLGSTVPPAMLQMEYAPSGKAKRHVVIIGKGVTFDSGGLSLKTAKGMENMKDDMAGAAAVIATMFGLWHLKPQVRVTGLVLATENMPSGSALKPGDVITACNGKTIEVLNTDAEGRLTLADALSYAESFKPDEIIDLATLTGACLVALGDSISAILGNSPELIQNLIDAAKSAGEALWQLPLYEDYRDLLKSDVADLKNIGGAYGGTLTAALFLSEFVEKAQWAHLDIAGPAWSEKEEGHLTKGGTGFGVRTLLNYLCTI